MENMEILITVKNIGRGKLKQNFISKKNENLYDFTRW